SPTFACRAYSTDLESPGFSGQCRRGRAWLMLRMILVLGLAPACEEAPSRAGSEMKTAAAEGICLTELRSDRIEIVPLDGGWREHRIPRSSDAPATSWGRMAADGSYGVASDARNVVGVTIDGRQLWIVRDISPSGLPAIS